MSLCTFGLGIDNELVKIIKFTGGSKNTVCNWVSLCKDFSYIYLIKGKYFEVLAKYWKIMKDQRALSSCQFKSYVYTRQDEEDTNRNYSRRINGSWVVGSGYV